MDLENLTEEELEELAAGLLKEEVRIRTRRREVAKALDKKITDRSWSVMFEQRRLK